MRSPVIHRDRVTTSSRCGSPGEGDSGFVQGSRLLWAHGKREFLNGSATQVSYTGLLAFLRSQVVGREEEDSVGRERETRRAGMSTLNLSFYLISPHSVLSPLVHFLSWCPVSFLKVQISFLWFSIICTQQPSWRYPKSSMLWPPPPSPDLLPRPPHFQVSAPVEAPGSQHLSAAFLPSCPAWWSKTSLPSAWITFIQSLDGNPLIDI